MQAYFLYFAGLVVLGASVGVFLRARYGYAIDDHPLCGACGFDLTGKPEGSGRCSECGGDLSRAGAIRIGHRAPYRRTMFASGGVAAVVFAMLAGPAMTFLVGFNHRDWIPGSWLLSELRSNDPAVQKSALQTLSSRRHDPNNHPALLALVDRIIAAPDPPTLTEQRFVESIRTLGALDDERLRAVLSRLPKPTVLLPPQYRPGDPLPIRLVHSPFDARSLIDHPTVPVYDGIFVSATLLLPGLPVEVGFATGEKYLPATQAHGVPEDGALLAQSGFAGKLPPGKYEVRLRLNARYSTSGPDGSITEVEYDTWHTLQILPEAEPVLRPINDPALAAEIKQQLKVSASFFGPRIDVQIENTSPLRESVAAAASVLVDTIEYPIGKVVIPANSTMAGLISLDGVITGLLRMPRAAATKPSSYPSTLTLILRPDPNAALGSFSVRQYLDEELRFEISPTLRR